MGKRVLVTGLSTFWGGRVAQALEADPDVEVIVGLDRREPTVELERTEYVRADDSYSILSRIVEAARIDTVLHTFLVVDSTTASDRRLHEANVIGTMNLLAAASAAGSSVRQLVVKSSTLVYGSSPEDPVWFREETPRSRKPHTRIESSLLEVEGYLRDFTVDYPAVATAVLRFSNVLGPDISTPLSRALERMVLVPSILGFDPRFQFVAEEDVIRSILFVLRNEVRGTYNVAGDGLLPWSEVAHICGKRTFPMAPYGTPLFIAPLRLLGIDLPLELLELLRFGRGVDNRTLKRAGFRYDYTSAGTVEHFAEAMRLRQTVGEVDPRYVYERDVESFFRHSPAVVRTAPS